MKNVLIEPVLNGFIVTIGCSRVCFTDIDTLCAELKRYQVNPDVVEGEYREGAINKSALILLTHQTSSASYIGSGVAPLAAAALR